VTWCTLLVLLLATAPGALPWRPPSPLVPLWSFDTGG
jgi:hypothetical protein